MRPIVFFYMFLGAVFVFCVYMTTLGTMSWWHMIYYIILGFLGVMGVFYPQPRWGFIIGVILGVILLFGLYKYGIIDYDSRFPGLNRMLY